MKPTKDLKKRVEFGMNYTQFGNNDRYVRRKPNYIYIILIDKGC